MPAESLTPLILLPLAGCGHGADRHLATKLGLQPDYAELDQLLGRL
jgi:hypothetical protein